MGNKELEGLNDQLCSTLKLLYRDTLLDEKHICKYYPKQIIKEMRYTDMTYIPSAPVANCRYLIATSHAKNLSEINPFSKKFGHMVLPPKAYFKILDIIQIQGYNQIILLHLPNDNFKFFEHNSSHLVDKLIEMGRLDFQQKIKMPAHIHLQGKDWLERTEFPLGMDENYQLYLQSQNPVVNFGIQA